MKHLILTISTFCIMFSLKAQNTKIYLGPEFVYSNTFQKVNPSGNGSFSSDYSDYSNLSKWKLGANLVLQINNSNIEPYITVFPIGVKSFRAKYTPTDKDMNFTINSFDMEIGGKYKFQFLRPGKVKNNNFLYTQLGVGYVIKYASFIESTDKKQEVKDAEKYLDGSGFYFTGALGYEYRIWDEHSIFGYLGYEYDTSEFFNTSRIDNSLKNAGFFKAGIGVRFWL